MEGDRRSRSHHGRRVLRRARRRRGLRRRPRRRRPPSRGVSNQAGLPQVPLPEIVRAPAGVHAGGGRHVHVPVRGPVRPPLRRKLFPLGVGVPQPAHGHAQDRRRLLPRPPPPRLRHRPALPLLRPLEGSTAVRGAGAGDGGGVLAGLRRLAGGRLLHGVPADGVAAVRAGVVRRCRQGRRRLGLVAVLRHAHRQPHQAVVPLHHPGLRGLPLRGSHQQPVPRRRLTALRALLLLRLPRRPALHAATVPARRRRGRGRSADAVLRREAGRPEDPAAAAAAVPAHAAAVVPAVAVDAVRVPQQGRAGQQPRGAGARVLPPVPPLLPPAIRRDVLPRQDAAPARRPDFHRRREVQAEAAAADAAPARRTPPAAPPPLPPAAEDLIILALHGDGDQRIFSIQHKFPMLYYAKLIFCQLLFFLCST